MRIKGPIKISESRQGNVRPDEPVGSSQITYENIQISDSFKDSVPKPGKQVDLQQQAVDVQVDDPRKGDMKELHPSISSTEQTSFIKSEIQIGTSSIPKPETLSKGDDQRKELIEPQMELAPSISSSTRESSSKQEPAIPIKLEKQDSLRKEIIEQKPTSSIDPQSDKTDTAVKEKSKKLRIKKGPRQENVRQEPEPLSKHEPDSPAQLEKRNSSATENIPHEQASVPKQDTVAQETIQHEPVSSIDLEDGKANNDSKEKSKKLRIKKGPVKIAEPRHEPAGSSLSKQDSLTKEIAPREPVSSTDQKDEPTGSSEIDRKSVV